jgi:hypothetical protein
MAIAAPAGHVVTQKKMGRLVEESNIVNELKLPPSLSVMIDCFSVVFKVWTRA